MRLQTKREAQLTTFITKSAFLVLGFVLLVALSQSTLAAVGGSISGTVTDASGAGIPKATVIATNTSTGVQQTVASNAAGAYSFPTLPVGHYSLDVTAPGFRPYSRT